MQVLERDDLEPLPRRTVVAVKTPYSVEILGDRVRIATRPGFARHFDVFTDLKELLDTDLLVNTRQELSHDVAAERFKHFSFSDVDFGLLKYLKGFGKLEDVCLLVLYGICGDKIPCHELRDGEKRHVAYWNRDDEIDPRIQRFIDIREDLVNSYTSNGSSRKRTAKGSGNDRAAKKTPKTRVSKSKPKDRTADEILEDLQESLRGSPEGTPRTLPVPTGTTERFTDVEGPVQPELVLVDSESNSQMSSERRCDNSGTMTKTSPSSTDQEPVKQTRISRKNPICPFNSLIDLTERDQDDEELIKREFPVIPSSTDAIRDRPRSLKRSNTTERNAVEGYKESNIEPATTVENVATPTTPRPSTAVTMADRIAIKELKLEMKEIQLELDFGEDQPKQRGRLGVLAAKLEIAQMRYEM